ncbi:sigma-54-dependent Fis family transcriptional regulator [bacterium]|nr:sigma-54-dependent Fis family transcriptional regulator [bacterium]
MTAKTSDFWILIVDDDVHHRAMVRANLEQFGYRTLEVSNGRDAIETARREHPNLIIMDMRLPECDGITAMREIRAFDPQVPMLMMTGYGTIETAVQAIKTGAYDYLLKPVDVNDLQSAVENGLHFGELKGTASAEHAEASLFPGIVWKSPLIEEILKTVSAVAPSDASVLITGESGTGKELVADAIQRLSRRAGKPFIKVNCAALHEQLLESELFGHEKGAFTGALEQRKGRFELADTGTLFLDEIGDMAGTTQAKILRVLQSGTFERLGGTQTIEVDVRVIAATNKDLKQAIEKGAFRKDLFYRLSVVPIHLPALRERRDEIPLLAEHFLRRFAVKNKKPMRRISAEALRIMVNYNWPGNVRELENAVERAVILGLGDSITPDVLPAHIRGDASRSPFSTTPDQPTPVAADTGEPLTLLEQAERDLIIQAMIACGGNRTKAAEQLGMSRRSLYTKLKRYGLETQRDKDGDEGE